MRIKVAAFLLTALTIIGAFSAPASAYYPNPQPAWRQDHRPPVLSWWQMNLARQRVITGKFFMGHNWRGERICWVVYSDGSQALIINAC